ncbi:MAG: HAMP domain-containing protein [Acidobacteria bacterium]|nr:HAMP domain-containing protein [Acidobacteriota bacterium]
MRGSPPGRHTAAASSFALAVAATLTAVAGAAHLRLEASRAPMAAEERSRARLAAVEVRLRRLVLAAESAAGRVATLPETLSALAGEPGALARLFATLDAVRLSDDERPALAVHVLPLATRAWSGRITDPRALQGIAGPKRDVFVLAGSVTTTLVATRPILGPDGRPLGIATAELPVAIRRNIRNEYLSDFDRLAGEQAGVEVRYVDARDDVPEARAFPDLADGAAALEETLRAPDGGTLAHVRVRPPSPEDTLGPLSAAYRRVVSGLGLLALLAWTLRDTPRWRLRLAAGATALRALPLLLGPPVPAADSRLLSADVYASTALGPLTRSPLDLLLTSVWVLVLAGLLFERAASRLRPPARPAVALVVYLATLPALGGVFAWVADTSANCSLDLESIALVPASAAHLVLQISLLLVLAAGGLVLGAILCLAGPVPTAASGRLVRLGSATLVALAAFRLWPRDLIGLPLVPAVALVLLAALPGAGRPAWQDRLGSRGPGALAGLALATVALLALMLYPTLVHYGEKNARQQIEHDHAPLVRRQPQWREYVLRETRQRIDVLNVLEDLPWGSAPPLLEELAFAVWSSTDLAAFGFSSAVEIQDPAGSVVSRFALNLPAVGGSPPPLPQSDEWVTGRDDLPAAGGGGQVLHARRLLSYHGEVHGAVHVYVKDDFWNLPFIRPRDPYSVLYRTSTLGTTRSRPLALLAYDRSRRLLFSSAEQPPALSATLLERVRRHGEGFWTTLAVDGRPQHTFLFADSHALYGLAYPRMGAGRFTADLVEAGAGLTLLALVVLFGVLLVRTALGRARLSLPSLLEAVTGRFTLRLFAAFVAVAIVPVLVLQVVVRGFVADRLRSEAESDALERAAVAKKAVEDYVLYQRGEAPGLQPGLDAGLVYIASLVGNDLDVFHHGRLVASSKRELYDSGLLHPRVPGTAFRSLVLDSQPAIVGTEGIGGFSYLVASVPVRLDASEAGILSMPLGLRQKEVEAVLEDLDRTIRLASALFLVAAGALAHSMARRISEPIREVTAATRRIAEGDLAIRVAATSRDELLALVDSFNRMAADLERQRADLERSNRLAAWAEMARQVAHEVKNPLTPIQLSAEHLRRVYRDRDVDFAATLEACTETILKQVRTLRGIVTEFSAFARPPATRLEPQDLQELVSVVVRPYGTALPPGVRLVLEAPDVPQVNADRRLLERAVVNLVENALQAVGERGTITVRLQAGDDRVEVVVEDDGPGVDAEARARVFEPFFSTKTAGSGLGLALVKKIAEDHGGGVALDSGPGGTRATLWLPAASAAQRL